MERKLQGQVALVTGSSRGLGRAYAEHLARLGADVVVHDISPEAAAEFGEAPDGPSVAEAIARESGVRTAFLAADLTDYAQTEALVAQALERFGRIDVLVNNAGGDIAARGGKPKPNDGYGIPPEDIVAIVHRNLIATMYACRAVVPHMVERGEGRIINISSVAALVPVTDGVAYAVAKAGIIHYTRCLAKQLRPKGVRVNCIAPGPTVTARFLATRYVPPERLQAQGLERLGRPQDLARVVEFLATDLSDFVTGEVLTVGHGIL